jgi:hypothetical protein
MTPFASAPALAFALGLAVLPAGPALAQGYGAIAYSTETGEWGWSRNYATRLGAEWRALQECRSAVGWGRDCRLAIVVRGACAALAAGSAPAIWGAGRGATPTQSARAAQDACGQTGRGCAARLQVCSP